MDADRSEAREHPSRGVVPGTYVRLGGMPARVGAPAPVVAAPTIELIRSGEVVQAIDIVCSCGQHIRLHCLYE
jgi:hypothetical protein